MPFSAEHLICRYVRTRVVYRFGIFGRYSVGISRYLPYRYRRKIRSVHFGIKKGAVPPFFLKRGAMAPFLRSSTPFWKKGGRKGGKYTKKGGIDTDQNTENPANLIPAKYRYRKNCRYHRDNSRNFGYKFKRGFATPIIFIFDLRRNVYIYI